MGWWYTGKVHRRLKIYAPNLQVCRVVSGDFEFSERPASLQFGDNCSETLSCTHSVDIMAVLPRTLLDELRSQSEVDCDTLDYKGERANIVRD